MSAVKAGKLLDNVLVVALLNLNIGSGKDDFDMARMALVGVNATVCAVGAAAGFLLRIRNIRWWCTQTETYRGLIDNNVLDRKILNIDVFGIGVRLGVLQEAEEEFNGLFGPTTWYLPSENRSTSLVSVAHAPCVVLNSLA